MTYIDAFVAAVPTANRQIFKEHAEAAVNRLLKKSLFSGTMHSGILIGIFRRCSVRYGSAWRSRFEVLSGPEAFTRA